MIHGMCGLALSDYAHGHLRVREEQGLCVLWGGGVHAPASSPASRASAHIHAN
jgi:hypothetical protein